MVNTDKVIGFYTDVFGNEIDEYEQIEKYTVCYEGYYFVGDSDGWNSVNYDDFDKAMELYRHIPGAYIKDNEYGVIFENDEWS